MEELIKGIDLGSKQNLELGTGCRIEIQGAIRPSEEKPTGHAHWDMENSTGTLQKVSCSSRWSAR